MFFSLLMLIAIFLRLAKIMVYTERRNETEKSICLNASEIGLYGIPDQRVPPGEKSGNLARRQIVNCNRCKRKKRIFKYVFQTLLPVCPFLYSESACLRAARHWPGAEPEPGCSKDR